MMTCTLLWVLVPTFAFGLIGNDLGGHWRFIMRWGVTASFTQPLDATSDLVTLVPTVILGAEVLGSEVGFVFVKS